MVFVNECRKMIANYFLVQTQVVGLFILPADNHKTDDL